MVLFCGTEETHYISKLGFIVCFSYWFHYWNFVDFWKRLIKISERKHRRYFCFFFYNHSCSILIKEEETLVLWPHTIKGMKHFGPIFAQVSGACGRCLLSGASNKYMGFFFMELRERERERLFMYKCLNCGGSFPN